jgi:predicted TIM-barrel enzyme
MSDLSSLTPTEIPPPQQYQTPVIGTIALLPLPGSEGWTGAWATQKKALLARVEQEAYALLTAGVDSLCVENSHDFPFSSNTVGRVDPAVTTLMTQAVNLVQRITDKPVGISVLQNDPETALAIAMATGASFIRVPVLLGTRVTETGMMPSRLQALTAAYRRWRIDPRDIQPWVDVTMHHVLPIHRAHQPWANPVEYLTDMVAVVDEQDLTAKIVLHWTDLLATAANPADEHPLDVLRAKTSSPLVIELPNRMPDSADITAMCQYSKGVIIGSKLARKQPLHVSDIHPAVEPFELEGLVEAIHLTDGRSIETAGV